MVNENEKHLGHHLDDPEFREQFDHYAKEYLDEIE